MSHALNLRAPHPLTYGFHTTLAYRKSQVPTDAIPGLKQTMADLTARFQARIRALDLARPAVCSFADMNAFPPVRPL